MHRLTVPSFDIVCVMSTSRTFLQHASWLDGILHVDWVEGALAEGFRFRWSLLLRRDGREDVRR